MKKKDLKNHGINEAYLSEKLGRKVANFNIEKYDKGAELRADFYRLNVSFEDGICDGDVVLFVKDFRYIPSVSGKIFRLTLSENKEILDENELDFLKFGTERGIFTPTYYGDIKYENDVKHNLIIMENFDKSLEDKLLELGEKKLSASSEEEKLDIEKVAFDYLKRVIDIALINDNLATKSYRTHEPPSGLRRVYKLTEEMLREDIISSINGLVTYKLGKIDEERPVENVIGSVLAWSKKYDYSDSFNGLNDFIIKPLVRDLIGIEDIENGKGKLVNLNLHPSQVLIKEKSLEKYNPEEYDSDAILSLKEGRKTTLSSIKPNGFESTQYDGLAITDNNKIGYGSSVMDASLINHISVFNVLSRDRLEQLKYHLLIQEEKLKRGQEFHLEDFSPAERKDLDEKYAAASRWAWLRGINYISWLKLKHPKNAERLETQIPIYNPEKYINCAIDYFTGLEDTLTQYFGKVNEGIRALKFNQG